MSESSQSDVSLLEEGDSSSNDSGSSSQHSTDSDFAANVQPYNNEPLAPPGHQYDTNTETEDDDKIPYHILGRRKRKIDPVDSWCLCGHCSVDELETACEFRCCQEMDPAVHKLYWDCTGGQAPSCITKHPDYPAFTSTEVLKAVAPLLRDCQGRPYKQRAGQSEKQFLRAVAYRWLIRWICGPLGWEKARPLPACIYEHIRKKFPSYGKRGFSSTEERD